MCVTPCAMCDAHCPSHAGMGSRAMCVALYIGASHITQPSASFQFSYDADRFLFICVEGFGVAPGSDANRRLYVVAGEPASQPVDGRGVPRTAVGEG